MPKYSYKLTNGKSMDLEGDTAPSDDEVETLAKQNNVELQLANTPEIKQPPSQEGVTENITPTIAEPAKPQTQNEGLLKKLWRKGSEPLTDLPSRAARSVNRTLGTGEFFKGEREHPLASFGSGALQGLGDLVSGLTSPINLIPAALTGGESLATKAGLGGTAQLLNIGGRVASAPVAVHGATETFGHDKTLAERGFGLAEMAGGIAGMRGHVPEIAESIKSGELPPPPPPGVKNVDPNFNAGKGNPELAGSVPYPKTEGSPQLPTDLKGAKPRFNIGTESYTPQFESDLDKSLYIIAQKTPSKRDADYLKFAMEHTGLGEPEVRQVATAIRAKIKGLMQGQQSGDIQVGKLFEKPPEVIPNVSKALEVANPLDEISTKLESEMKPSTMEVVNDTGDIQSTTHEPVPIEPDIVASPTVPESPIVSEVKPTIDPRTQALLDKRTIPNEQIPSQIGKINQQATVAKMIPKAQRANYIREALDTQRTLLTAFDISAPGRQGLPLIGRKEWWTSWDDMFKSWGSKEAFDNVQRSILEHPSGYFEKGVAPNGKATLSFAEKAGLDLTNIMGHNEEQFRSRWADKIPGVGASNRAFVSFLNKLRSDTFINMIDLAKSQGKNPETDVVLAKQIADFINNATGRGHLGKLEPNVKLLSDVFFAPRLMASRVKTWTQVLNPKFYTELDPMVRKEALKSLLAVAGTGTLMGELSRLAGAQINNDPTSTDFRKIRIGNTRIDPYGGFQQYPVAATKLLTGKATSSTSGRTTDLTKGRYGQQTRASVVSNFFKNKLAPVPSFVWSWMEGKEFDGTPFDAKQALLSRTVPIVMQDLASLAKEDPSLIPLIIPSAVGMGVQTYGR